MNNQLSLQEIRKIRLGVTVSLFGILFFFLFSSEFLNSIFNQRLDDAGLSFADRVVFTFKPAVLVIYLLFAVILSLLVFRYLSPLFNYLSDGSNYDKARVAVIKMPWALILFQITVWFLGTTAYYISRGWEAESGIPYGFGLLLKITSGVIAAIYVIFAVNYILKRSKLRLNITDIREGEYDSFSRIKDLAAILAASAYIVVNTVYIAYYYSQKTDPVTMAEFLGPIIPTGIFLTAMGFGTILLLKRDYSFQMRTLLNKMDLLASGKASVYDRIQIINFDELGEMGALVNRILDRFHNLLSNIQQTVAKLNESAAALSSASQQSSTASNQQAASVSEVVSTMEDSDRLSKAMEERAKQVEEKSTDTKLSVEEGVHTVKHHVEIMDSIRSANRETIDFIISLNRDIKAIWEVVTIINSIADQVKIIAFNAELEASAAGEAGKNFEIVATEIRRLADNTVASTMEIKTKIGLIEKAARGLVESSDRTTDHIEEGWEMTGKTDVVFQNILNSSEETLETAHAIANNIRLQIHGFEQILLTMKQIAEGAEGFSQSTKTTSETARDLQELVESLENLTKTQ